MEGNKDIFSQAQAYVSMELVVVIVVNYLDGVLAIYL